MNNGEWNYLHSYKDKKEAMQERIDMLAEGLRKEYWQDESMLIDAIKEGLGESESFVSIFKKYGSKRIPAIPAVAVAIVGALAIKVVNDYLREQATIAAENELL